MGRDGTTWRVLARPFALAMPYADIAAFVFLLLSGALALAHSDEWPSGNAWSKGHPLLLAQLLVFVLLGLTQLAILIAGRRGERDKGLEESCQLVAAYIDEHCPEVQLRNVGVHIWTVGGAAFRPLPQTLEQLSAGGRPRAFRDHLGQREGSGRRGLAGRNDGHQGYRRHSGQGLLRARPTKH